MSALDSALRLFKALPVDDVAKRSVISLDADTVRKTLPKGFIIAPGVSDLYPNTEYLIAKVDELYGRDTNQLNAAFHKSFAKVRDASIHQLYIEQIAHYLTTYTPVRFHSDHVYIPNERLDAPELDGDVRLTVIRGMTKAELKEALAALLASGIALSDQTVADALELAKFIGFTLDDIALVRNYEVQVGLYDQLGRVPASPQGFMRFLIYKATGKPLVIKNPATIAAIKERDNSDLVHYFNMYDTYVGLESLAEVFYRYKPLFLAFRTNVSLKKYVNRIRRLAVDNHVPMPEDYLNSVTARAKNGTLGQTKYAQALGNANTFRKVRLAYALKFRTTEPESIMYRIRNGKSFAKEFSVETGEQLAYVTALYDVLSSIVSDLRPKVEGKTVYVPEGLSYALPATEKQFTGNIPSGSCVTVADDMVVGIHWMNVGGHTDLDLSVVNADGKLGWDGGYRNGGRTLLFSGDLTDAPAPNGAAELFHVGAAARGSWLVNLNNYDSAANEVPFKLFIGREEARNVNSDYVVDPNKVIAQAASTITVDSPHKTLGLIVADDTSSRFYFTESSLQSGISTRNTEVTEQARKFLVSNFTDPILLKDVLRAAGAVFVDKPEDAEIDLSLEAVDKSTLISLLS